MSNRRVIYTAHDSAEWYTPLPLRQLARSILGSVRSPADRWPITLDPATSEANPLGASAVVTKDTGHFPELQSSDPYVRGVAWGDVMAEQGIGGCATLWLNPPYGRAIGDWLLSVEHARDHLRDFRTQLASLVLVPARPGARWYASSTRWADLVCELDGRVRFDVLERGKQVTGPSPARWGCALLYTGPERRRIGSLLRGFGVVRIGCVRPTYRAKPGQGDPRQQELFGNVVPIHRTRPK